MDKFKIALITGGFLVLVSIINGLFGLFHNSEPSKGQQVINNNVNHSVINNILNTPIAHHEITGPRQQTVFDLIDTKAVPTASYGSIEDVRPDIKNLLITCEEEYKNAHRDSNYYLMETCFAESRDIQVVRRFSEPPKSPHDIRLRLIGFTSDVVQNMVEGKVDFKTIALDVEKSHEVKVKFKKTTNGWRIADGDFLNENK